MSDPRFELANFSVNHGFATKRTGSSSGCITGCQDERAVAAVRVLRFMSAFREAMWSVLQQAISDLDFDFRQYAAEQFAKMRAAASGEEFRAAMDRLEAVTSAAAGPARRGVAEGEGR